MEEIGKSMILFDMARVGLSQERDRVFVRKSFSISRSWRPRGCA